MPKARQAFLYESLLEISSGADSRAGVSHSVAQRRSCERSL